MTYRISEVIALMFGAISVFFNSRSGKWADRCLYIAYAAMFFALVTLRR